MRSKTTQDSPENKIRMLELQAKQVLNAVQKRVVVINAFPNNKLNPLYWQKIEQAMTFYGQLKAYIQFLQEEQIWS